MNTYYQNTMLTFKKYCDILRQNFMKGNTTMTVFTSTYNTNTVIMHGIDTIHRYSPGLHCRTQIAV